MAEKRKVEVLNPTANKLTIFEVGIFKPGKNKVELTEEQIKLLADNNILEYSIKRNRRRTAKTTKRKASTPRQSNENNDENEPKTDNVSSQEE